MTKADPRTHTSITGTRTIVHASQSVSALMTVKPPPLTDRTHLASQLARHQRPGSIAKLTNLDHSHITAMPHHPT
jgi:hypothetical protein